MLERISEEAGVAARDGRRTLYVGRDRPIRIAAGHRLQHHDGKCARPHGHNYEITLAITGDVTDEGWIVDKGDVTDVIEEWDHRFLLEADDPLVEAFADADEQESVVVLEDPPTAEVMSIVLEEKLVDALPETVADVRVQVAETNELTGGSPL